MVKDKKVLPHLSSYANDPERIERKANEMAKEGWLLEKFGSLFSTYRRGKAGEYEYRVQVKEAGIDRLTYIAELTEFGIEEVGGVGDLLVLRKKADGTPFDLYSDLDSLIAQQKKAVRYLRAGLLLSLGWMSITLMNILMTLMNANVIGKYTGSFAIESVFTIPGLGREFVMSIANRDYTLILGLTVFMGTVVILLNLLTDLLGAWLDPSVRRAYRKK